MEHTQTATQGKEILQDIRGGDMARARGEAEWWFLLIMLLSLLLLLSPWKRAPWKPYAAGVLSLAGRGSNTLPDGARVLGGSMRVCFGRAL
jgi:hypothetical protein